YAAAGRTGYRLRTVPRARALACIAIVPTWHANGFCGAAHGLLKGNFHGITQISAARRAATARATKNIAKHVAKNIAKASTTGPRTTKAALTTAYAGMAKLVVSSALLRIRKHFIGFFSFFEFIFCFFVIWVS